MHVKIPAFGLPNVTNVEVMFARARGWTNPQSKRDSGKLSEPAKVFGCGIYEENQSWQFRKWES
jgi:hypothetical protein